MHTLHMTKKLDTDDTAPSAGDIRRKRAYFKEFAPSNVAVHGGRWRRNEPRSRCHRQKDLLHVDDDGNSTLRHLGHHPITPETG